MNNVANKIKQQLKQLPKQLKVEECTELFRAHRFFLLYERLAATRYTYGVRALEQLENDIRKAANNATDPIEQLVYLNQLNEVIRINKEILNGPQIKRIGKGVAATYTKKLSGIAQ